MKSVHPTPTISAIDDYITTFPPAVQDRLQAVRKTIAATAPEATEAMSYGIPTFKLDGNLVHFAAFKEHIGFYPGASGIHQFEDQLKAYKTSKGTVQFPFSGEIPHALIAEITRFRMAENKEKKEKKQTKK